MRAFRRVRSLRIMGLDDAGCPTGTLWEYRYVWHPHPMSRRGRAALRRARRRTT